MGSEDLWTGLLTRGIACKDKCSKCFVGVVSFIVMMTLDYEYR